MGCDGGTIPKRDELVRTKKKPEQVRILHLKFFFELHKIKSYYTIFCRKINNPNCHSNGVIVQ